MPKGIHGSKAPHGTKTRYMTHGCRCDECRRGYREWRREYYGYRSAEEYNAEREAQHGSESRYKQCHCALCREAARQGRARRRRRAKAAS